MWFVAKDVCEVLELEDVSSALRGLDTDEKMTLQNQQSHSRQRGGAQMLNIAGRKKNKLFILSWPIFASPFRQNTGKGDFFIPVKKSFQKVSNDKRI